MMREPHESPPSEPGLVDQDNHLWLEFWRDERTDFHQSVVNPLLSKFWSSLDLAPGSRVFVPLCGKSLDMIWLAQQGHEVIGVELSPVAVADFFRENGLQPVQQQTGTFTIWSAGKLVILCGDYFALDKADLGQFDTVYDRSALTALPENIRDQYVAQLRRLVPDTAKVFLLTVEDAAENATCNRPTAWMKRSRRCIRQNSKSIWLMWKACSKPIRNRRNCHPSVPNTRCIGCQ